MRYMIGSDSVSSFRVIAKEIPDVGTVYQPGSWRPPQGPYALDNGAYAAWNKSRRVWDQQMQEQWLLALNKLPPDNPPVWVLLPDAVADWPKTVELAGIYLPIVRQRGFNVAIALQDGCSFEQVMEYKPAWVFVAGSTQWKEDNIGNACTFFHAREINVHVGRVNTRRRMRICQAAAVDSCDGTCLNKYRNANLTLLAETLRQPCLLMS